MIIAKCISVIWMLTILFIALLAVMRLVNKGSDPFSMILGGVFVWVLFGFVPVFVAKFAWGYIR